MPLHVEGKGDPLFPCGRKGRGISGQFSSDRKRRKEGKEVPGVDIILINFNFRRGGKGRETNAIKPHHSLLFSNGKCEEENAP